MSSPQHFRCRRQEFRARCAVNRYRIRQRARFRKGDIIGGIDWGGQDFETLVIGHYRETAREKILTILGIPPQLIGQSSAVSAAVAFNHMWNQWRRGGS